MASSSASESPREAAAPAGGTGAASPILLIPWTWIGDFVRCHSVVRVLKERFPDRPVDIQSSSLCAPLADYMPGVRKAVVVDLPRRQIALARHRALGERLRAEHYGTALVMLGTWKSALAPFFARIPERIGFVGEFRYGLLNDVRHGEMKLERMLDRCGALALPRGAKPPPEWPLPQLVVPAAEIASWRGRNGLTESDGPVVALAPGAVGKGKAWPVDHYAELARQLAAAGVRVWVLGGPNETPLAAEIVQAGGERVRDLTGNDLRNAILALAAADLAVSNDSGLMHVAAAIGTPTIGLFGPTSPRLWAPINPLAAIIEPPDGPCPSCGRSGCQDVTHRRTADIAPATVMAAVRQALPQLAG